MSILLPVAQSSIFFWIRSCSLHDKLLPCIFASLNASSCPFGEATSTTPVSFFPCQPSSSAACPPCPTKTIHDCSHVFRAANLNGDEVRSLGDFRRSSGMVNSHFLPPDFGDVHGSSRLLISMCHVMER